MESPAGLTLVARRAARAVPEVPAAFLAAAEATRRQIQAAWLRAVAAARDTILLTEVEAAARAHDRPRLMAALLPSVAVLQQQLAALWPPAMLHGLVSGAHVAADSVPAPDDIAAVQVLHRDGSPAGPSVPWPRAAAEREYVRDDIGRFAPEGGKSALAVQSLTAMSKDEATAFVAAHPWAVKWADFSRAGGGDFFHGTTDQAVASIKEHGLIPHGGAGADATFPAAQQAAVGDRAASVYMVPQDDDGKNAQTAIDYGRLVSRAHPGTTPVILAIRIPKEHADKVVSDERSRGEGAVRLKIDQIPPAWIKVLVNPKDVARGKMGVYRDLAAADGSVTVLAVVLVDVPTPRDAREYVRDELGQFAETDAQPSEPWLRSEAEAVHLGRVVDNLAQLDRTRGAGTAVAGDRTVAVSADLRHRDPKTLTDVEVKTLHYSDQVGRPVVALERMGQTQYVAVAPAAGWPSEPKTLLPPGLGTVTWANGTTSTWTVDARRQMNPRTETAMDLVSARHWTQAAPTAQALGFDPDQVRVSKYDRPFEVGGQKFAEAGHYDPRAGEITLNSKFAFEPGLMAHEVTHDAFHRVGDLPLGADPAATAFNFHLYDNASALAESDGVTDYSRAYWRAIDHAPPAQRDVAKRLAVNETLAELSALKARTPAGAAEPYGKPVAPVWREAHTALMAAYRTVPSRTPRGRK